MAGRHGASRHSPVLQAHTLNEVVIDFVGLLPRVSLMKARARSLCVLPALSLRTVSVSLNGGCVSIFTRLLSM
jgi:hypothetical protein